MRRCNRDKEGKKDVFGHKHYFEESFYRIKRALDKPPINWLGSGHNPDDPEVQKRRKISRKLWDKVINNGVAMKLYRFETFNFHEVTVVCNGYEVIKETPAGYWIDDWSTKKGKRWVSKTGFKRFAYVDKVDAAANYLDRSRKHIEILLTRLANTREAITWFEKNKEEFINGLPVELLTTPEVSKELESHFNPLQDKMEPPHECVDDGGFLLGSCKICGKLLSWP